MRRDAPRSFDLGMFGRYLNLAAEYRAQGDREGAKRSLRNAQRAIDAEIRARADDRLPGDTGGDGAEYEVVDE